MIDHLSLVVSDLDRARGFYDAALAPLGYTRLFDVADFSGYGAAQDKTIREQALPFWIGRDPAPPALNGHVCFKAPSREAVRAFYRFALSKGARDNGPPGLRPQYHPNYYAAFVIDPDGHRIEAVCHTSE
jgi:catechol 2,3-dioxygenase-like lactoylglutathione lyase family enzyme